MNRTANMLAALVIVAMATVDGPALTWDSGHHVFSEGSETFVYMYNDASAEITGGWIAEFYMYNNTSAEISGGTVSMLCAEDASFAQVYEGADIGLLRPNDSSTANVYGGDLDLFALGLSITNLYRGTVGDIGAIDSSVVNLYVESYLLDPIGGRFGDGLLTGIWLNTEESFRIDLAGDDTIDHLNFVPEPASVFLFAAGSLLAGRIQT